MKTIQVAVGIICEDGSDRVLAVRRERSGSSELWEFPGGKIERGETSKQACSREIYEELHVRVGELRDFYTVEYDYPDAHVSMSCFLCAIEAGEPRLTEQVELRWVSRRSLFELRWLPANAGLIETLRDCAQKPDEIEAAPRDERKRREAELVRRRAATRKTMRANKRSNTKPELIVRQRLRAAGLAGYRLQWRRAPGRPDIAFPGRRIAIFVNGCFWHRCPRCDPKTPKRNVEFWRAKFRRNVERDTQAIIELKEMGWQAITIWECELVDNRIEATMASVIDQIRRAERKR